MKKKLLVATIAALVLVSLTTLGLAAPSPLQTTFGCPTYQTTLVVAVVDATPTSATVGGTVVVKVNVVYEDGTPVTLSPQVISFLWTGPNGQIQFDNVPVTYTGTPGFYEYTQNIKEELVQATGTGTITIAVVACSCSDGIGNRGPTGFTNSDLTLTPSDNSKVAIGPPTTPPAGGIGTSLLVPLIIAALLIIALLLFFLRGRKKKK